MSGVMDYAWDTSDEEGGMEIDLNPKASPTPAAPAMSSKEKVEDYDPCEPTDDYDPSEPTKDSDAEGERKMTEEQSKTHENFQEVSDYDPEEPTLSDEDAHVVEDAKEKSRHNDGLHMEEEEEGDGRWNSQLVPSDEEEISEIGGAGGSQDVADSFASQDNVIENSQENELLEESQEQSMPSSPKPRGAVTPTDTDDNTEASVAEIPDDNFSDVPEVTFDESDFVLEKEPFEKEEGMNRPPEPEQEEPVEDWDPSVNEERERTRRQEEIDSRNEEALVDVFREESDPERINEETEQPTKKTKKKVGSKKLKKKGKKVKKGQGKKGSKGQDGSGAGDQRFVEIRRERQSVESREEGEVEGDGEGGYRRKMHDDRIPLELAERSYESLPGVQDSDEQREPGEIVEMEGGKKRGMKKREKKEKKKKKSRREVATIEDGAGEDDSQKFPSFLAGFFVQDEDVDENVEPEAEHFNQAEEHHFTKGAEKNYRKRHDSGAEDSVKSFEQNTAVIETHEVRVEEVDHRRGRRHDERRRESREQRHGSRDTRDVRRDRDVRHGTSRERERDRERGRGERERLREKDRDSGRERDRSRRSDLEERPERRRHRSHSRSQERRRRSRSRDRSSRHHRNRSRSRDRSLERDRRRDREREKERERSKRRHRERSRDREVERRVRRVSLSRSRSPHRRSERASSNKENRNESSRGGRRRHEEPEDSENEGGHYRHHHHRSNRHRRAPSTSSSSSSSSSSGSNLRHHRHHHLDDSHLASSDDGASSDVILVEPERIVINLDDEEDPPSRVDITHANADNSTTLVDGESIPPPPELSGNARPSALIEINPASSDEDGDATPTRDEPSDNVSQQSAPAEGDYDPAHPTEEEDRELADSEGSPLEASSSAPLPSDKGPMPPPHPPPEEVRPSPPPPESQALSQQPPLPRLQPPPLPPQQQPGHLPFPQGGAGQSQRFPWPAVNNGPRQSMLPPQANGPSSFHPQPGGRALLPTPDARPMFPQGDSAPPQPNLPFAPAAGGPMGRDMPPPISSMAPLAQLTSLLPALERAKLAAQQGSLPPPQLAAFKVPLSGQAKGPLTSTSNNMPGRGGRGGMRGGDFLESTEVVDMDMSPGEDDCELELPSPPDSDGDGRGRRRGRRGDHQQTKAATAAAGKGGPTQTAYLKALSKMIEKLTPKGQQQGGQLASSSGPGQERGRHSHRSKRSAAKVDLNDDDVPASAVDLTNKEKFMKKLHLQERVIDEVKLAIKPFYASKKITKEQYKLILRKAVPKICHCKSGNINPQKIQQLVEAYVSKMQGNRRHGKKKKGGHAAKDGGPKEQKDTPPVRQNGEQRPKKMAR